MLMDILMESLMSMDEDTLDYVLESCSDEEIDIISSAMEEISQADANQIKSGYKLDTRHGVKGFVNSFKNSGSDRWKSLAHDIKTHIVRIKNNLKGEGNSVSSHFGDAAAEKEDARIDRKVQRNYDRMGKLMTQPSRENDRERYMIQDNTDKLEGSRIELRDRARAKDPNFQHNNNSWSYKLGNYLQKFHK